MYNYFHLLIGWLDTIFTFLLVKLLHDLKKGKEGALDELKSTAYPFVVNFDGIFMGCIGALDGLAVRIRCPGVLGPLDYFCTKTSMHSTAKQYAAERK